MIGSLNLTGVSLRSIERCEVCSLPARKVAVECEWFLQLWSEARPFTGKEDKDLLTTPPRSQSARR